MFTPTLVEDGSNVVVGSKRVSVEAAIQAASAPPVPVALSRSEGALDAGENDGQALLHEFHIVREADILSDWDGVVSRLSRPPPARVWWS